ncbi:hypothetical protein D9757_004244 [Collybiopsis confluens]|uniref:Uncharacterized protein n=1 Tax=Collybiopsis confluens TaxID=2823264 RepID=A0A8H5HUC0_9AGAR|nr:hypothetical protein D9757_004244 [Collybiopsis confluens]
MLASEIMASIPSSYDKGLASGSLFFFPSTVEFEIRLCPALQKKPKLPTPHFGGGVVEPVLEPASKVDPFAPPYDPGLYVGDLDEDYVVLLNKYSVLPRHFLLITKEFQSQTSPLMPDDLLQAYSLLVAAKKAGRRMFAFYNCGKFSRLLLNRLLGTYLVPGTCSESLAHSVSLESPGKPFAINSLPYANHVFRFPRNLPSQSPEDREPILANAFLSLFDLVVSTIRHEPNYPAGMPSYNVILTLEHLHLIPRRTENHLLQETKENLAVNSLGYAGMLLVKSDREMEAVKKEGVGKILRSVALESVHEILVNGEMDVNPML